MLQYNMYNAVPADTRLFAVHSPFNHNNQEKNITNMLVVTIISTLLLLFTDTCGASTYMRPYIKYA